MAIFLFLSPFSRLPLGSLESEVNGLLFFSGSRTKKMLKATLPAFHNRRRRKPAQKQRINVQRVKGMAVGSMLVFGSVTNGLRKVMADRQRTVRRKKKYTMKLTPTAVKDRLTAVTTIKGTWSKKCRTWLTGSLLGAVPRASCGLTTPRDSRSVSLYTCSAACTRPRLMKYEVKKRGRSFSRARASVK